MRKIFSAFVMAGALLAPPAYGQQAAGGHDAHHRASLSEGEVRKVDKSAKKITIKHGPLANLDMPPMTMVFQVKDPAMLDKVKAGDKVKFVAEKVGGAFTVTQIEPVK